MDTGHWAVLFDRDGTLVDDQPYCGDPAAVLPCPGARAAVEQARQLGAFVAMVTNQSGVGRGLLTIEQVEAVNARVAHEVGPFDEIVVCPHAPWEGCDCRKPHPGLVLEAVRRSGIAPGRCVVIGDRRIDVLAGLRAGCHAVQVHPGRLATQIVHTHRSLAVAGARTVGEAVSMAYYLVSRSPHPSVAGHRA